ncbi:MAG: hypothetical protein AB8G95_28650 [Anaerolineae bacterium]
MSNDHIFLNCVTVNEMKQAQLSLAKSAKNFTLQIGSNSIINSKQLLFQAINNCKFPMDPPNPGGWAGIADSLFGGFRGKYKPNTIVNIIWPFADDVSASNMFFLIKAVRWFKNVAISVSPYEEEGETNGVILKLFLVCSNERTKKALEDEFWFLD